MTRGLLVWAVVWTLPVVLVSATGCASRSTSSPFIIKNGSGPVDVGHGVGFKKIDRGQIERARREALARRAAAAPEQLRSIEGTDVALRNALAALGQLESAAAHVAVAQQYWRLHVYDAVYDHYTDAIRLEPRNVTALDGRARVWRQWHMTEPALSDAHRARYFGPERPDVLNTLGIPEVYGYRYQLNTGFNPNDGTYKQFPVKEPFSLPIVLPTLGVKVVY